jgi:hypothetical protein
MRHRQIKLKHLGNRADHPLSLSQRKMKDLTKSQRAEYGSISIDARPTATRRCLVIDPGVAGTSIKPDREATAINEGGGILIPVTGAVLGFGIFVLHKIRLPDLLHP